MIRIPYRIELLAPAIIPSLEGEPNSAVSSDYIPGSIIRGLLIGAHGKGNLSLDEDTKALFFSDNNLFLNAYLLLKDTDGNPQIGYPAPATWQQAKYSDDKTITDSACRAVSESLEQDCKAESKKMKGMNSYYATVNTDKATIARAERLINVHTQRHRHEGVQQQVFRYEALAKGQIFEGEIRCLHSENAKDVEAYLRQLLEECAKSPVYIGGSRSAGYGRTRVSIPEKVRDWQSKPFENKKAIISFISPMILQSQSGQYIPDLTSLISNLEEAGITIVEDEKDEFKSLALLDTMMVGGFNRKWGLPLPQTSAIRTRSVLKVRVEETRENAIENLARYGLGERRNEGFGQVLINWQKQETLPVIDEDTVFKPRAESVRQSHDGSLMQEILGIRFNNQVIDRAITDEIYGKTSRNRYNIAGNSITRTQIGRLRHAIKDELRSKVPSRKVIADFLKFIEGKAADVQFSDTRIGKTSLKKWLESQETEDMDDIVLLRLVDATLERKQKEIQKSKRGAK